MAKKVILTIDDEEHILDLLEYNLEKNGYRGRWNGAIGSSYPNRKKIIRSKEEDGVDPGRDGRGS